MSRLTRSVPAAQAMMKRAAERGENMGGLVANLLELLDIYGAAAMETAVAQANANERVGPSPVRMALQSQLRAQGRTAPRPVLLSDERLREITVPPPDLSTYDRITEDDDAEDS